MSDTVIRVENLGKKFIIGHQKQERYTALRDVIANGVKSMVRNTRGLITRTAALDAETREEFWALQDVSFEVRQGDRLGIIGRNGAGKSTLLKVLSRIIEPSKGRVTIHGRVASLLEVGTGFHPELTGRENIFLNGAILGMSRAEIRRKFDEIVAFAETDKFLDTPVKRYSSGMYIRLAFAVAAHLEPEILVVDEVLAVGDAQFQRKCLGKMEDVSKNEGRTVLFVSHNTSALSVLCNKGIYLKNGQVNFDGSISEALSRYLDYSQLQNIDHYTRTDNKDKTVFISHAEFKLNKIHDGNVSFQIRMNLVCANNTRVNIQIRLKDERGEPLAFGAAGALFDDDLVSLKEGQNSILLSTSELRYANGKFIISMDVTIPGFEFLDTAENCFVFEIPKENIMEHGCKVYQDWRLGSFEVPFVLEKLD